MILSRHARNATLVLVALVGGSLLAPLSHYAFMAWSDAHRPVGAPSAHHGAHHADHHAVHTTPPAAGAVWEAPDEESVLCTYAALFATFAAASVPGVGTTPASDPGVALLSTPILSRSSEGLLAFQSRGPPVAIG
jgi:hypothetical protein